MRSIAPARLAVVTALLAGLALAIASPAGAVTLKGTVASVVDGDTFKVRSKGHLTTVRMVGIDTPETRHPSKPIQCYGPSATREARNLLKVGRSVRLVSDSTQDTRDRYGRFLAYVYLPGRSGAKGSVNYTLVARGAAKVYVYSGKPFLFAPAFRRAQTTARSVLTGLWGTPCLGNTTKPEPSPAPPTPTTPTTTTPVDTTPTTPITPTTPTTPIFPTTPTVPTTPTTPQTGCDPNYTGACVPFGPPDVDCSDVRTPVMVVGSDPHRLDGDGDGYACESYS
jgi:micrococcal nuclease